jgi:hypothetical protein
MDMIFATAATASGLFAGTNVDDMVVLAVLNVSSRAGRPPRGVADLGAGQYAGIAALVVISLLAALGLGSSPRAGCGSWAWSRWDRPASWSSLPTPTAPGSGPPPRWRPGSPGVIGVADPAREHRAVPDGDRVLRDRDRGRGREAGRAPQADPGPGGQVPVPTTWTRPGPVLTCNAAMARRRARWQAINVTRARVTACPHLSSLAFRAT